MPERKLIAVDKNELKAWKKLFSLSGQKAALYREKNISRETLNRILKEGKGSEQLIESIREYHFSQQQPA